MTAGTDSRIDRRFKALRAEGRSAFIPFITAGDPDIKTSARILAGLPGAGADLIEIGVPFTDPMADGPAIQEANLRALKAGVTLRRILSMVAEFRQSDHDTPIILMGYANPILAMGEQHFVEEAARAGVDGLIVVDMPPEEDSLLRGLAEAAGLCFVRLATPTSDDARLPRILDHASGFIYYVAVAGITGGKSAAAGDIKSAIARLRRHTKLPVAVGFGIKTAEQVAAVASVADAAVVGSALVNRIRANLDPQGHPGKSLVDDVLSFVADLATGVGRKTFEAAEGNTT